MAYFHCLIGGGSSGGGYELTVTCDAAFAGTTITCTDGVTTLTQTCPSASPYEVVFAIPNGGEWTISGIISGQTYSTAIDIPDSLELHSTPEGSTVLPTDDIQTWLACAGITDKSYTTLNEVLADSTTLLALMSNDNAVDYLVRSTTWASGLTADSTAMTDIGANNYCADTLLADSTWLTAIGNSTYFESVINAKVPSMTSNTAPSGVVSASSYYSAYNEWKAFNGSNTGQGWFPANTNQPNSDLSCYLQYEFPSQLAICKMMLNHVHSSVASVGQTFELYGSNTGNNDFVKIADNLTIDKTNTEYNDIFVNSTKYKYYRICFISTTGTYNTGTGLKFQLYGRADV